MSNGFASTGPPTATAAAYPPKTPPVAPHSESTKAAPQSSTCAKTTEPLRDQRTGRPIIVLLDLLGRRWALRILWELGEGDDDQGLSFRDLQARCGGLSPSVLNTRLKELREAGLVERIDGEGYRGT
ncbi:MAG: helix-turn-helix transcriptional regulator, partial [bacterium]|nr:helix-turn-helix transcriptional regulator [bacterium]